MREHVLPHDPVGDLPHVLHVVRDDHRGDLITLADLEDHVVDVLGGEGIEAGGARTYSEAVAALPHRTQAALLDALAESIFTQPPTDWSKVTNLGQMRAVPEVKNTVNLAQQYADLGYDSDALISRLAEIVVHDNFTEMHAFKHHQATFEEFHTTRLPWRWRHLVSAAQASAISYGKNMEVYEEAVELLHA